MTRPKLRETLTTARAEIAVLSAIRASQNRKERREALGWLLCLILFILLAYLAMIVPDQGLLVRGNL